MMEIAENAIFKFVSLRRPNDGLIIDPTDDVPDSDVIGRLEGVEVNPANPSSEVLNRLETIVTFTKKELGSLIVAKIHNELAKHNPQSFEAFSAIQVNINGRHRRDQLTMMSELVACYRQVIDSWLVVCWINNARNFLLDLGERSKVGHALKRGEQPCVVASPKNSS